ncbi:MAG TPA: hypothetical protein VLG38_00655 [Gammaproteobacteria bacterium]|nr:hypothetical protein [Gammaproteobacteria bacterium]
MSSIEDPDLENPYSDEESFNVITHFINGFMNLNKSTLKSTLPIEQLQVVIGLHAYASNLAADIAARNEHPEIHPDEWWRMQSENMLHKARALNEVLKTRALKSQGIDNSLIQLVIDQPLDPNSVITIILDDGVQYSNLTEKCVELANCAKDPDRNPWGPYDTRHVTNKEAKRVQHAEAASAGATEYYKKHRVAVNQYAQAAKLKAEAKKLREESGLLWDQKKRMQSLGKSIQATDKSIKSKRKKLQSGVVTTSSATWDSAVTKTSHALNEAKKSYQKNIGDKLKKLKPIKTGKSNKGKRGSDLSTLSTNSSKSSASTHTPNSNTSEKKKKKKKKL